MSLCKGKKIKCKRPHYPVELQPWGKRRACIHPTEMMRGSPEQETVYQGTLGRKTRGQPTGSQLPLPRAGVGPGSRSLHERQQGSRAVTAERALLGTVSGCLVSQAKHGGEAKRQFIERKIRRTEIVY